MGEAHYVSFHSHNRCPCNFIHTNKKEIIETEEDKAKWPSVKDDILKFMNDCFNYSYNKFIKMYMEQIKKWENPSDINLFWSDDSGYLASILHDVTKLLILEYPGKICSHFEQCDIWEEFPDQDYDICTFEYAVYHERPKFVLYRSDEENFPNPNYRKREIERLKIKIKQLKSQVLELKNK